MFLILYSYSLFFTPFVDFYFITIIFTLFVGRLGAISAQFINGSLEKHVTSLLLVTSMCMIIGGSCAFFLPDDHTGHALKETADENKNDKRTGILTPEDNSTEPFQTNPINDFHIATTGGIKQTEFNRNQNYSVVALNDSVSKN